MKCCNQEIEEFKVYDFKKKYLLHLGLHCHVCNRCITDVPYRPTRDERKKGINEWRNVVKRWKKQ